MTEPRIIEPVSGFESLRLCGESVVVRQSALATSRMARIGDDEVVLVYDRRGPNVVVSHRIPQAFSSWPVEPAGEVEHLRHNLSTRVSDVTGWGNGTFAWKYWRWTLCSVDEPGSRYAFEGQAFPDLAVDGGAYTLVRGPGELRVVHRAKRSAETHVVDCGALPADLEVQGTVTEGGRLILAGSARKKQGLVGTIFTVSRAGIERP